ncbi:MAG: hypothetical protein ACLGI9_18865, partial [Thermoanaerobaculia bacterium]
TLGWGGPMLLRVASFLGAFLLMLGAKRYYRNAYGEVEQQAADPVPAVFSPAGPVSRIEDSPPWRTPLARHLLVTAGLAVVLFVFFQVIPRPHILIKGNEALGQHPRIVPESALYFGPSWQGHFENACSMKAPSMLRAVAAQMIYVLYGSLLLGVYFWRERRESQSHHLILAALLLGLSGLGTSLGFLAGRNGEIASNIDLILPALVYPGVALLACGSAMILAGLVDHWQLVRALGPRVEG